MTDQTRVEGGDADVAEGPEEMWGAWGTDDVHAAEQPDDEPQPEPTTEAATEPDPEVATDEPPVAEAPWPAGDEWEDLRQVLAGEDQPAPVEDDVDEDDVDELDALDDEDDVDDDDGVHAAVAALADRVEELSAQLDDERAAREALAVQLDRLASELDAVLGEALADERAQRLQIEEALREVQTTLSEAAPAWDGTERRAAPERRVAGDRRRTGARRERPLRARDYTPEPVADDIDAPVEDADAIDQMEGPPSVWKSRLNEVAGSVSAWSADDIDRLRVD